MFSHQTLYFVYACGPFATFCWIFFYKLHFSTVFGFHFTNLEETVIWINTDFKTGYTKCIWGSKNGKVHIQGWYGKSLKCPNILGKYGY